jgi:hypothetical protein
MPMSVLRLLEPVYVIIRIWESRPPRRQKIRCRAGLAETGFNCGLPNVLTICHWHAANASGARGKDDN